METDLVGDKIGGIHIGEQDLGELQTRKMKGLKRGRDGDVNGVDGMDGVEQEDIISEDGDDGEGGVDVKRVKVG